LIFEVITNILRQVISSIYFLQPRTVIDGQLRDKLIAVDNNELRVKWAENDSAKLSRFVWIFFASRLYNNKSGVQNNGHRKSFLEFFFVLRACLESNC